MKLILTSEFEISWPEIRHRLGNMCGKNALFIPTAAYGEGYKIGYEKERLFPFESLGMNVDVFDLSNSNAEEVKEKLEHTDLVYVDGGNTFYLLEQMKKSGFYEHATELLKNKIYIGSSAGSIVASPDIKFIEPMDDISKSGLNDYTGLNWINFLFLPHVGHETMGKDAEEIRRTHDGNHFMMALNDKQAFVFENGVMELI